MEEGMALAIGEAAPDFNLPATDGQNYSFAEVAGDKATVIMFWCNHCPYVIPNQQRVIAMQAQYASRGVKFAAICANRADVYPEDNFESMKLRAEQMGYNFPYLHDESQAVAHAYGAQRTPEVYVFDAQRKLRYHGRIDDNHEDISRVHHHDLRDAVEAVLASKAPDPAETGAYGCTIKWK
jgi:peroxiredoxin